MNTSALAPGLARKVKKVRSTCFQPIPESSGSSLTALQWISSCSGASLCRFQPRSTKQQAFVQQPATADHEKLASHMQAAVRSLFPAPLPPLQTVAVAKPRAEQHTMEPWLKE
jgi:hypothetical protein